MRVTVIATGFGTDLRRRKPIAVGEGVSEPVGVDSEAAEEPAQAPTTVIPLERQRFEVKEDILEIPSFLRDKD